jgi:hypothetical protein
MSVIRLGRSKSKVAALVLAVCGVALARSADAAIPIYAGGPATNFGAAVHISTPTFQPAAGQSRITNNGIAIYSGIVSYNGQFASTSAVSFSPTGYLIRDPLSTDNTGKSYTTAIAINQGGTVIASSVQYDQNASQGSRAVRYAFNSTSPTQLNSLGVSGGLFAYSNAFAINEAGASAGESTMYAQNGSVVLGRRAVRWQAGSTSTFLLDLFANNTNSSGYGNMSAVALNESNTAVGNAMNYSGNNERGTRAMRWMVNGAFGTLNGLGNAADGSFNASATGINNAGITIGRAQKFDASNTLLGNRAVRWGATGNAVSELGVLGGVGPDGQSDSEATDITENGLVVGWSEKNAFGTSLGTRAVYWNASGNNAVELPNLGSAANGTTDGIARSANNGGAIVGTMDQYANGNFQAHRAVLWNTAGTDTILDLNTLIAPNSGWVLTDAYGISETGFVVGAGSYTPTGLSSRNAAWSMLVPQAGTYGKGDANLDTKVDFTDLVRLAQNYGQSNPSMAINVADFNLDGVTNFNDLVALAQNYNLNTQSNLQSDFASDWALAQSLVPEPMTLLAGAFALPLIARRQNA